MAHSGEEPLSSNLEQHEVPSNADFEGQAGGNELSFGLAPGAGSTSYLGR